MRPPLTSPEELNELMIFVGNKVKGVKTSNDARKFSTNGLARQFIEETRCPRSLSTIYQRIKSQFHRIHEMKEFDNSAKVKMLIILVAPVDAEFLIKLRKDADVEIDGLGCIEKYKAHDGSLELDVEQIQTTQQKLARKLSKDAYVEVDEKGRIIKNKGNSRQRYFEENQLNWQKDYEKKRIDLVKFLIERTKNAKYPISIPSLAADFKTEFNGSGSQKSSFYRIENFRQRIHEMNQFDMSTKVKMMFALSASVDAKFLKEIQKDAFVELDEMKRIKKYKANNGSLELEGDHSLSAKTNVSIGSTGEEYAQSIRSSQSPAAIQKGRKRASVAYSSSEVSKKKDYDEKSMPREMMDCDTNTVGNGRYDYFHHDPSYYEEDTEHIQMEKKPESLLDVKTEMPSTKEKKPEIYTEVKLEVPEGSSSNNLEYHYEEHNPVVKKPKNLLKVKTEETDGPSTSSLEYHYEENLDYILIEPKPEVV